MKYHSHRSLSEPLRQKCLHMFFYRHAVGIRLKKTLIQGIRISVTQSFHFYNSPKSCAPPKEPVSAVQVKSERGNSQSVQFVWRSYGHLSITCTSYGKLGQLILRFSTFLKGPKRFYSHKPIPPFTYTYLHTHSAAEHCRKPSTRGKVPRARRESNLQSSNRLPYRCTTAACEQHLRVITKKPIRTPYLQLVCCKEDAV